MVSRNFCIHRLQLLGKARRESDYLGFLLLLRAFERFLELLAHFGRGAPDALHDVRDALLTQLGLGGGAGKQVFQAGEEGRWFGGRGHGGVGDSC